MNGRPTSWWSRNWKWFVPTGCLGLLLLGAGGIALLFVGISGMIRSNDAYQEALRRARSHPELQQALGTPIEDGRFIMGSLETSGESGRLDISVPLSGPRGEATLYVVADRKAGVWHFSVLEARLETGERLPLIE